MQKMLFFSALWICSFAAAQDTVRSAATLTHATVYLGYGAELVHGAKVKLSPESRIIRLSGLSTNVDPNSLQIACPESVAILSHRFELVQPTAVPVQKTGAAERLYDSVKLLQREVARIDNLISIEQEMLNKTGLLIEGVMVKEAAQPVSSGDVLKLLEFYHKKIETGKLAIFELDGKKIAVQVAIAALHTRIGQLQPPPQPAAKPYGQLTLQVVSETAADIPFTISYYTPNAGWTASYDIRANSKDNQLKIVYKAALAQHTGIDWKKIKLTLSTGTPNFAVVAPELVPWNLQLYVPAVYNNVKDNAARNQLDKRQMGYLREDEVIVNGYGRNRVNVPTAAAEIDPASLQRYVQTSNGQLSSQYDIALPYDITSNGELHSVTIKEQVVETSLTSYTVPKIKAESYLLADISEWEALDLLPGSANVIMDETYIGRTVIDPNETDDTLSLSLGKDKRVAIARQLVKELSSVKTSGTTTRQFFTYEITVKNNKQTDVSIQVKDQYPLSTLKDVEVKLEDGGGGMVNTEMGVITWKVELKPGESRKLRFAYSIKSPKGEKIANPK